MIYAIELEWDNGTIVHARNADGSFFEHQYLPFVKQYAMEYAHNKGMIATVKIIDITNGERKFIEQVIG